MPSRPSDRHSHSPQGSTPHPCYCRDKQKESVNLSSEVVVSSIYVRYVILEECVPGRTTGVWKKRGSWDHYKSNTNKNRATYFKTRVSSLIACTATSYSLSRVMETIRSYAKRETTDLMSYLDKMIHFD